MSLAINKHIPDHLPKSVIAHSFGRKATAYDRHATVQPELVRLLVEELAGMKDLPTGLWLDAGCGTGAVERQLRSAGLGISIVGLDIAHEPLLLQKTSGGASTMLVHGDIDNLPFKAQSFSGIITASALQWVDDPAKALHKLASLIRAKGMLGFSVFIAGSFEEVVLTRTHFGLPNQLQCIGLHSLLENLSEAGFSHVTYLEFAKKLFAPSAAAHLKNLSRIGAAAVPGKRLNRNQLKDFCDLYESRYKTSEGVPLTFRAIVGTCRKVNS